MKWRANWFFLVKVNTTGTRTADGGTQDSAANLNLGGEEDTGIEEPVKVLALEGGQQVGEPGKGLAVAAGPDKVSLLQLHPAHVHHAVPESRAARKGGEQR